MWTDSPSLGCLFPLRKVCMRCNGSPPRGGSSSWILTTAQSLRTK
uniref:Uncharacterized protein n=1 Tax=Podoviridae sp. ctwJH20 TaxID=2827753 RepID=A0A8S5TBF3_9CAUD|nr:MAG TPA: hypothetical protein [Podoviridae sp. ctwJH20]